MAVVDKAIHNGITRSDTNSARTTVDENIRKARRATYSLMGTGLLGENGLKSLVCISASRGNSPDIIYTAGSDAFIVRTTIALKASCNNFVCHLIFFLLVHRLIKTPLNGS
jgi:hypothetical protein